MDVSNMTVDDSEVLSRCYWNCGITLQPGAVFIGELSATTSNDATGAIGWGIDDDTSYGPNTVEVSGQYGGREGQSFFFIKKNPILPEKNPTKYLLENNLITDNCVKAGDTVKYNIVVAPQKITPYKNGIDDVDYVQLEYTLPKCLTFKDADISYTNNSSSKLPSVKSSVENNIVKLDVLYRLQARTPWQYAIVTVTCEVNGDAEAGIYTSTVSLGDNLSAVSDEIIVETDEVKPTVKPEGTPCPAEIHVKKTAYSLKDSDTTAYTPGENLVYEAVVQNTSGQPLSNSGELYLDNKLDTIDMENISCNSDGISFRLDRYNGYSCISWSGAAIPAGESLIVDVPVKVSSSASGSIGFDGVHGPPTLIVRGGNSELGAVNVTRNLILNQNEGIAVKAELYQTSTGEEIHGMHYAASDIQKLKRGDTVTYMMQLTSTSYPTPQFCSLDIKTQLPDWLTVSSCDMSTSGSILYGYSDVNVDKNNLVTAQIQGWLSSPGIVPTITVIGIINDKGIHDMSFTDTVDVSGKLISNNETISVDRKLSTAKIILDQPITAYDVTNTVDKQKASIGDNIDYTLHLSTKNENISGIDSITFSAQLPEWLTFNGVKGIANFTPENVSFENNTLHFSGSIGKDSVVSLNCTVNDKAAVGNTYTNTVSVSDTVSVLKAEAPKVTVVKADSTYPGVSVNVYAAMNRYGNLNPYYADELSSITEGCTGKYINLSDIIVWENEVSNSSLATKTLSDYTLKYQLPERYFYVGKSLNDEYSGRNVFPSDLKKPYDNLTEMVFIKVKPDGTLEKLPYFEPEECDGTLVWRFEDKIYELEPGESLKFLVGTWQQDNLSSQLLPTAKVSLITKDEIDAKTVTAGKVEGAEIVDSNFTLLEFGAGITMCKTVLNTQNGTVTSYEKSRKLYASKGETVEVQHIIENHYPFIRRVAGESIIIKIPRQDEDATIMGNVSELSDFNLSIVPNTAKVEVVYNKDTLSPENHPPILNTDYKISYASEVKELMGNETSEFTREWEFGYNTGWSDTPDENTRYIKVAFSNNVPFYDADVILTYQATVPETVSDNAVSYIDLLILTYGQI